MPWLPRGEEGYMYKLISRQQKSSVLDQTAGRFALYIVENDNHTAKAVI